MVELWCVTIRCYVLFMGITALIHQHSVQVLNWDTANFNLKQHEIFSKHPGNFHKTPWKFPDSSRYLLSQTSFISRKLPCLIGCGLVKKFPENILAVCVRTVPTCLSHLLIILKTINGKKFYLHKSALL